MKKRRRRMMDDPEVRAAIERLVADVPPPAQDREDRVRPLVHPSTAPSRATSERRRQGPDEGEDARSRKRSA
ncbi:hypothetical protein HDA32_005645 [Spinactinospora alkalitolerans]|uniref:Uncharacterized protein n=1 Tax=Spinactinospora alkalitolerans TaxID=687207 RepID=A0A852U4R7_9ACTN|nr:hypothetical protein [Spinactinospora alkalitolerans]NYE50525.1 hypothetical protein [Spinactinospora alkalitolerans]